MSSSNLAVLPTLPRDIDTEQWRERLRRFYSGRDRSRYWAFDFAKAWAKFQRGVRQESEMANLVGHWMDLSKARVLVIGSYLGSEAIAYALRGADVVGIDLDEQALALSRKLAEEYGVRIHLLATDASRTAFDDASFDYVSCAQVLEHLPPAMQPRLLAEIWRLCKPGGLFWIDTPNQWAFRDHHDTGLPLIHWLPRVLKVPLARALGRAVPDREPAFGSEAVYLHYYLSYFRLRRILKGFGPYEILSRYRGYAGIEHYRDARRRQGRSDAALFPVKAALLGALLRTWNFNWFSGIRLMIRKLPAQPRS
jgi:2-polyprenyl-3-methyl-5-hydroxy-6-metoxy-1,4-benzoquinol methylase